MVASFLYLFFLRILTLARHAHMKYNEKSKEIKEIMQNDKD